MINSKQDGRTERMRSLQHLNALLDTLVESILENTVLTLSDIKDSFKAVLKEYGDFEYRR